MSQFASYANLNCLIDFCWERGMPSSPLVSHHVQMKMLFFPMKHRHHCFLNQILLQSWLPSSTILRMALPQYLYITLALLLCSKKATKGKNEHCQKDEHEGRIKEHLLSVGFIFSLQTCIESLESGLKCNT